MHGQWTRPSGESSPDMYMRITTGNVSRSGNTVSLVINGSSTNSPTGMNELTNDYGRYFGYSFEVYAQLDGGTKTLLFSKGSSPANWDDSDIVLGSNKTISVINTTSTTNLKIWFESQCGCDEPESSDGGLVLNIALDAPPANYVVSYNGNKPAASTGTVQNMPSNQTKTHGTNLVLSSTKPTLIDYNFSNWNTSANGSGTSYSPGGTYSINAAVTLYAQWQIKTYTVTFVDGWGSTLKTQTVNYGGNATPPANPTHTGYEFIGWDGTYTNVTSNRTITAQWKILPIWIYNGSSWQRIKKAYKYQSGSWVEITPRIFNGTSWEYMT